MTDTEIQREYEAEGGLPGKVALGKVWRDVAVSCKDCGTIASDLIADDPGCDIEFFAAIKRLRADFKRCRECGQTFRIGLGRRE